jgi:hypothetical protein
MVCGRISGEDCLDGTSNAIATAIMTGVSGLDRPRARWMLESQDSSARRRARGALRTTLEQHLTPDGVAFRSAAWLITARRT